MEILSRLLVTYLANSLWMICIIAGVAIVCSKLLRRVPSAYMHLMWVVALTLASILSFVSLFRTNSDRHGSKSPLSVEIQRSSFEAAPAITSPSLKNLSIRHRSKAFPLPPLLGWVAMAFYGALVSYRATRLWRAWIQSKRIRDVASFLPLPESLRAASHCLEFFRVRSVAILSSSMIQGPVTLGVRKPVVIVPEWLFAEIPETHLIAALYHEAAHIRRHDFLLNLIYEVLLLPLSYHPVAAYLKKRVDQSRELACDEMAARFSTSEAYAHSLLNIAQFISNSQSAGLPGCALGLFDSNTLEERIMILLNRTNRLSSSRGLALTLAAVSCLGSVSLGASAFSFLAAPSTATHGNDNRTRTNVRVARITFITTTTDTQDIDLDVPAREIQELKNLRLEDWREEVSERTRDYWQSCGFFEAKVDLTAEPLPATAGEEVFSVTARVSAGSRYRLKALKFSGARSFTTSELEAMVPLKPGELFSTAQIRKGLENVISTYQARGYRRATIVPEVAMDDSDHTIAMTINIDEGPQSN